MKIISVEEMQAMDRETIEVYGIPGIVLMENAGRSVAEEIFKDTKGDCQKRIIILIGKGNNGGDGLVVARHLYNKGYQVELILLNHPDFFKGDAELNWCSVKKMDISYQIIGKENLSAVLFTIENWADIVVDAIFGTGFSGEVAGIEAEVISRVNHSKALVLSVDIPSGLLGDSGEVKSIAVKADKTVTFALPKLGLVLGAGTKYSGQIIVKNISIPAKVLNNGKNDCHYVDKDWCQGMLAARIFDTYKGNYGHVLALGGSIGMTGAITLTASAALRTGSGLVTAGVPASVNSVVETKLTEVMSLVLPQTEEGTIAEEAFEIIEENWSGKTLVIGPGISRHENTQAFVRKIISTSKGGIVVDADALYALKQDDEFLHKYGARLILTPHLGEMARLTGLSVAEIAADKLKYASACATKWQTVVVLKGHRTITATPAGAVYINSTGNPGMATAGSGDVLAGMIAALLAQGFEREKAAILGVYLHGYAGDLTKFDLGEYGLIAGDIVERIPKAILENGEK